MTVKRYEVLVSGGASDSVSVGDIVYGLQYHDYGLASDDTRITGIKHISVTFNEEGGYPSFTIPLHNLKAL